MIQFIIFISTILICDLSAKIYDQNIEGGTADDINSSASNGDEGSGYIIGDPLWVLHINNEEWLDSKLQLGTLEEQEDFYYVVGPLLAEARYRQASARVKKADPEHPTRITQQDDQDTRTNEELKNEIMKLVNKYALSTSVEPDSYLTESEDNQNPSISLYFKGPVSSIIVKSDNKQWHYVIKSSPFPEWFYERHDTYEAPLSIPEEIKNKFFSALLRVLKLMLSHPL